MHQTSHSGKNGKGRKEIGKGLAKEMKDLELEELPVD